MGERKRKRMLRQAGLNLLFGSAVLFGCGGDSIEPPTTGSLEVSITTAGPSPDPDGYTLRIDGGTPEPVESSGAIRFEGLTGGEHSVGLSEIAGNCVVEGQNPRTATVTAGEATAVTFAVTCATPPLVTGSLRISTTTTGPDPDPDGYAVRVDNGSTQLIGNTADLTVPSLSAGPHTATLSEVRANCVVSGTNPRDVDVPPDGTGEVSFSVACTAAPDGITLTDLGILPNELDNKESLAWGLNSAAPVQVAGHSTVDCCNVHGFLWTQASGLSDLGTLGPTGRSFAYAISDGGTIVGVDDGPVAFVRPSGGATTRLPLLGSVFGGGAQDISADGSVIVGGNFAAPGGTYAEYAVMWTGPSWTIDSIGQGNALGVSENHLVVGSMGATYPNRGRAVVWTKGVASWTATQLETRPSAAWDINPVGDRIAGIVEEGGKVLAAVWVSNGATWVRTSLASLGGNTSQALGVNNAGWVVGSSTLAEGTFRAVLWKPSASGYGPPQDLGSLTLGGESVAFAINENRQIVGFSDILGSSSQDARDTHAVLWTVP